MEVRQGDRVIIRRGRTERTGVVHSVGSCGWGRCKHRADGVQVVVDGEAGGWQCIPHEHVKVVG